MCYEWHGWLQTHLANVCTEHFEYRDHKKKAECNAPGAIGACHFLSPEMPPWIWTRRGKGNHGHWPELHASNRYEMLVVANGGSAHLTKKPVENVLDFPPMEGERFHAMQKPHDLCCEIIERTTVPGELVLDLCMGSGAHLAAAADKGRDFIGCDKNPENLASALALIGPYYHKATSQLTLLKDSVR
jgi:DNA modification methylase